MVLLTEKAQRQQFFDKLLNVLRPPSLEEPYRHGTFAACEAIKPSQGFHLSSIHVDGVGELQLPLPAEDTSKLRSICKPCGDAGANVGRCWQVAPWKLTFPGSPSFLSKPIQQLAMKAVHALGLDGTGSQFEARLDKLLLCDAGGSFTFRNDTEKEKDMLASLILQLPTEEGYTGGEVVVKHESKKKRFDCHLVSTLGFCYTVCHADCLQELQETETGSRLCLAFNLVKLDSPLLPDSSNIGVTPEKLHRVEAALEPWWEQASEGRANVLGGKLTIPFLNFYEEGKLSFAELQGEDKTVAELLKACRGKQQQQLDLHLCMVTKHETQYIDPDDVL